MFNSGLDLIADYQRAAFLLAYLVLAQQADKTYSQHDFESLESTKEYFYKLCRALPHDEDDDSEDTDTIEQFIQLMEETVKRAAQVQHEGVPNPDSSSSDSLPSTSSPDLENPDEPVPGYLSHLKSDDPALEALFTSPNPDPTEAIHAIMRAYAETMHDLLAQDLKKESILPVAQAALANFQVAVMALGAVSEKVGAVESRDVFGRDMLLRSGKGGDGGSGEYESIG